MTTKGRTRNPREIEADLDRTRTQMGDTLDALQQKLAPDVLFDQTLDYLRSGGGGEFTSNLKNSVARNPVPATLVGLGLGWLMLAGRGGSTDADALQTGEYGSNATSDTTSEARSKTRAAARSASARLEHMASSSREHMHQLSDGASRMGAMSRQGAARAKSGFEYLLNEQPLVLGAIGVALGAAVAAGLPGTRREDELMGEARDEVVNRARAEGKDKFDKAQRVAESARAAAREEAQREGLNREGAEDQLHKMQDKVGHVAGAARKAAKDEADKQGLNPEKSNASDTSTTRP